jgi:hypothetical protein
MWGPLAADGAGSAGIVGERGGALAVPARPGLMPQPRI